MLDEVDAVVYVADFRTYELLYVNRYATELFGADCVGKRCYQVLQSGQAGPCAFCTNDRLVVDGRPADPVEWELQNTVTQRWFLCLDRAIRWIDGRLVRMEIAVDVTEQKALALANERLVETAQRALRARDQLLAMVVHDLRNPLNGILLASQAIGRLPIAGEEGGQVRAQTQMVRRTVARMTELIDDLLSAATIETGHFTLTRARHDPRALLDEVLEMMGPIARERGLDLQLELDRELPPIDCDRERIVQVFSNLVGNAVKFTAAGGEIRIRTRLEGAQLVFSVEDTGPGIPGDVLPRIFDRYWQAQSARRAGAGLGLYICKGIVEAHGGRIWAESEVGRGTTFHFGVPARPTVSRPVDQSRPGTAS